MSHDPIDVHVGARLRRRRRLLGLTQQQLAGACGVRFQQIQKYECGANRISASMMHRACAVLGVSHGYLFEGLPGPADLADERPEEATVRLFAQSRMGRALILALAGLSADAQTSLLAFLRTAGAGEARKAA